jgi:hypothetical protein
VERALALLDLHYDAVASVVELAKETEHPLPLDTRGWSQILVSVLSGVKGLARKKGADLADGSDVKAASTWHAIDTPRFNGVLKAGTKAVTSGTIESLDSMPHLFFVLWDYSPKVNDPRCRVWAVRPREDQLFRKMCALWFKKRELGEIKSTNFQLHPPRGLDLDTFRNRCGNLDYPLYFRADRPKEGRYELRVLAPEVLESGTCKLASNAEVELVPMDDDADG